MMVPVNVKSIIRGKAKEKENHPLANTLQVHISLLAYNFSLAFTLQKSVQLTHKVEPLNVPTLHAQSLPFLIWSPNHGSVKYHLHQ